MKYNEFPSYPIHHTVNIWGTPLTAEEVSNLIAFRGNHAMFRSRGTSQTPSLFWHAKKDKTGWFRTGRYQLLPSGCY